MATSDEDENGTPQWFYYLRNDPFRRLGDGWYQYDPELNQSVEQLYQTHQSTNASNGPFVVTATNGHEYEVDFSNSTQRNTATGRERPIERSADGLAPTTIPELPETPISQAMPSLVASMAAAAVSSPLTPALNRVSLADLLRCNHKSLWKLKLNKDRHFEDVNKFCEALKENTTVTSVEVTWKFLRRVADPSLLLECLGGLENLEELVVEVMQNNFLLSCALRHASRLKCLRIEGLRFRSNQEVQELANGLRRCQSLRQIGLASVQFMVEGMQGAGGMFFLPVVSDQDEEDENGRKIRLDPLLDAMASLPNLDHIRLQHYLNGTRVESPSEEILRRLCHSPRRSLIFHSCGLSDQQCVVLADELTKAATSDLKILVVTRNFQISPLGWDAFVNMLAVNHSIVDFHEGEKGQRNAPSKEQLAKIKYYLGLNQSGRSRLLQGSMTSRRKAWFDFLVQGSHDMDKVFFAMQVDPSLYIMPEWMHTPKN